MNMRRVLLAIAGLLLACSPAAADVNYTQGSGTVIFDFTCFTTKHCSAHVPINSSGVEIFTAAAPAQVSLANTAANATPILTTANTQTADGADVTFGAKADAASGTGTVSAMSIFKQIHLDLGTLNTTAGSPVAAGANVIGYTSTDPCAQQNVAKVNVAISMQNTTTVKLVSLASAKKIYICSLSLLASGATVFSIADGTKVSTECDTTAEAVMGAAVAAHGLSLAANGGISYGNGLGTVAFTTTAAHDLCLFQSGSVDLSGNLTYVQQ